MFIFICSLNFAQNNFKPVCRLATDIKYSDNYNETHIIYFHPEEIVRKNYSFLNLSGQAILGSAFAVGFSILPLTAGLANSMGSDGTPTSRAVLGVTLGIITLSSYMFGSAVGVHLVAKSQNPALSFWGTVGYSAIGFGAGIALLAILASQYETIPCGGGIVLFFPIISSMVYASFISDWPKENENISFSKFNLSHKDIIERTKLLNLELFRIKL